VGERLCSANCHPKNSLKTSGGDLRAGGREETSQSCRKAEKNGEWVVRKMQHQEAGQSAGAL